MQLAKYSTKWKVTSPNVFRVETGVVKTALLLLTVINWIMLERTEILSFFALRDIFSFLAIFS